MTNKTIAILFTPLAALLSITAQSLPSKASGAPSATVPTLDEGVKYLAAHDFGKSRPLLSQIADRDNAFASWLLLSGFEEFYPGVQRCDPASSAWKLAKALADHGLRSGFRTLAWCSDPSPAALPRATHNPSEASKWRRLEHEAKVTPKALAQFEEGLSVLRDYAANGSPFAQLLLYRVATDTRLLSIDIAETWLKKAADQGLPEAEYQLAQNYEYGRGSFKKDMILWLTWMRKAADQNLAAAQLEMGSTFRYEWLGLTPNHSESRRWYQLAAQNKSASPQIREIALRSIKELDTKDDSRTDAPETAKTPTKTDLLLAAVESGDSGKVEAELKKGAQINSTGSEFPQHTALQVAVAKGDLAMTEYLLAHGADITFRDNSGGDALSEAATPAMVSYLHSKGADPNASDYRGDTPLHHIGTKNVEVTNALVAAGANPNAKNDGGETPIVALIKAESSCVVAFQLAEELPSIDALVRAGTDLLIADADGNTALSLAQDARRNCGHHGNSPEETAASRSSVSALLRIIDRAANARSK